MIRRQLFISCYEDLLTPLYMYYERVKICLNGTLYKPESCINRTLNKVPMYEIFVNLTCMN